LIRDHDLCVTGEFDSGGDWFTTFEHFHADDWPHEADQEWCFELEAVDGAGDGFADMLDDLTGGPIAGCGEVFFTCLFELIEFVFEAVEAVEFDGAADGVLVGHVRGLNL